MRIYVLTDRQTDGSQCRPEIMYFDAKSGCDIKSNVLIAHLWDGDIISQVSCKDGVAATKREQQKLLNYSQEFDVFGNPSNYVQYLLFSNILVAGVGELTSCFKIYRCCLLMKMDELMVVTSRCIGNIVCPLHFSNAMYE